MQPPTTCTLFDGSTEIQLQPPSAHRFQSALAVASLDRHLFLVTDRNQLLAGYVEIGATSVALRWLRSNVTAIHCSAYDARLYAVSGGPAGRVHHLAIHRDQCCAGEMTAAAPAADEGGLPECAWTELVVSPGRAQADAPGGSYCPHGQQQRQHIPMVAVAGNCDGLILTSRRGELYGMGRFGDVLPAAATATEPVRFECFRGLRVLQVAAAEHSVLVLTVAAARNGDADVSSGSQSSSGNSSAAETLDTGGVTVECEQCAVSGQAVGTGDAMGALDASCSGNQTTSTTETSCASTATSDLSDVFDEVADSDTGDELQHTLDSVAATPTASSGSSLSTSKLKTFLLDTLSIGAEGTANGGAAISSLVRDGVRSLSRHMSGSEGPNTDEQVAGAAFDSVDTGFHDQEDEQDALDDLDGDELSTSSLYSCIGGGGGVGGDSGNGQLVTNDTDGDDDDDELLAAGLDAQQKTVLQSLCKLGERRLATSVWRFGTCSQSQTAVSGGGSGKRPQAERLGQVLGLSGQGVCAIRCGAQHACALTLDGRLLVWGNNRELQIAPHLAEVAEVQQPLRFLESGAARGATTANVLAVACGRSRTELLLNGMQMVVMQRGMAAGSRVFRKRKEVDGADQFVPPRELLLGSMEFVLQNAQAATLKHIELHYSAEQRYVHGILDTYSMHLKPLLKRLHFGSASKSAPPPTLVESLCARYLDLLRLNVCNLPSMRAFMLQSGTSCRRRSIRVLANSPLYLAAFRRYTRRLCDLLAVPGGLDWLEAELATGTGAATSDKSPQSPAVAPKQQSESGGSSGDGISSCDALEILSRPLRRVGQVVELICTLSSPDNCVPPQSADSSGPSPYLASRRADWERLKLDVDRAVRRALATSALWATGGRGLHTRLYTRQRRLLLDSREAPLKWTAGGLFATPRWLLFNDSLCRLSGVTSEVHLYALRTLWVNRTETPQASGKVPQPAALRVISPEEQFELLEPAGQSRWLPALAEQINISLRRRRRLSAADVAGGARAAIPPVPAHRNASYTFSARHPRYPAAKYFGRWHLGRPHGMGHLELAGGSVYNGQFASGEISGIGRMFTPGVGIYAGDFVAGKYHGRGVLEQRKGSGGKAATVATYEGHFRAGLFEGHGVQRTDQYTYIGEFVAGRKCGYGVLDDAISGDKYMGMFADEKRSGSGVQIGMDGGYFEGAFVDDRLAGEGLAVLSGGAYYEGELTAWGPSGKGTMFLPNATAEELGTAGFALESAQNHTATGLSASSRTATVTGTILNGALSGLWDDVRINSGQLQMVQQFARVPRSLGQLAPTNTRKWKALFANWETEIFGSLSTTDLSAPQLWRHFQSYQRRAERRAEIEAVDQIPMGDGAELEPDQLVAAARRLSQTNVNELIEALNRRLDGGANDGGSTAINSSVGTSSNRSSADDGDDKPLYKSNLCAASEAEAAAAADAHSELLGEKRDAAAAVLNHHFKQSSTGNSRRPRAQLGPSFAQVAPLLAADLPLLRDYLRTAFASPTHPLGVLQARCAFAFYTAYGCWKVRPTPVLCEQAMLEWFEVVVQRIYGWLRRLFPALVAAGGVGLLEVDGTPLTARSLLHPALLSERVYSTMFVLYASKCSRNDELYRQRLLVAGQRTAEQLAMAVRLERHLWPLVQSAGFAEAVDTLKSVKEKFCPHEMLATIEQTFRCIDRAKREMWSAGAAKATLSADHIMPLSIFLVLRAGIPHLGAEMLLMEDLMGDDFDGIMSGFGGYCFVTIKATYQHILSSNFCQD